MLAGYGNRIGKGDAGCDNRLVLCRQGNAGRWRKGMLAGCGHRIGQLAMLIE